jgi:D-galactarolactone cycloisomerase
MTTTIDSIAIHHYRLPLDPPFHAAWDPTPRRSHTVTLVCVRAGDYEGVGSGDAMLGFAGHGYLFLGQDPFAIERHVQRYRKRLGWEWRSIGRGWSNGGLG